MSKIRCEICGVSCVGCSGKCGCKMNKHQVNQTNAVIEKLNLLGNKEKLDILIQIGLKGLKADDMIKIIESGSYDISEIKDTKEKIYTIPTSVGYCEYPAGSASQGKRVRCIHCGEPKFIGSGKLCKALINK